MNDYKKLIDNLRSNQNNTFQLEAADAIEQLVKERDAAVRDLQTYGNVCFICRNHDSCYSEFRRVNPKCGTMDNGHWEWRGVQEAQNE